MRDVALLASAVARPRATFSTETLYWFVNHQLTDCRDATQNPFIETQLTQHYPDICHKGAAGMKSLIGDHPFVDGNKRTGIAGAALFLALNGRQLAATNQELETFTPHVATSRLGF